VFYDYFRLRVAKDDLKKKGAKNELKRKDATKRDCQVLRSC